MTIVLKTSNTASMRLLCVTGPQESGRVARSFVANRRRARYAFGSPALARFSPGWARPREKGSAGAPGGERRVGLARAPWSLTKSPSDDAGGSGRCGLGTLPPAHGADVSLLVWGWDARPL